MLIGHLSPLLAALWFPESQEKHDWHWSMEREQKQHMLLLGRRDTKPLCDPTACWPDRDLMQSGTAETAAPQAPEHSPLPRGMDMPHEQELKVSSVKTSGFLISWVMKHKPALP